MTLQQFDALERGDRVRWSSGGQFDATVFLTGPVLIVWVDDGPLVDIPRAHARRLAFVVTELDQVRR